jgi:hypothetical protein
MSYTYAQQVMRDHCTITWDIPGQTIRDTTDEERFALRAQQAQHQKRMEPLAYAEIPGLKFDGPLRMRPDLVRAAHEYIASQFLEAA